MAIMSHEIRFGQPADTYNQYASHQHNDLPNDSKSGATTPQMVSRDGHSDYVGARISPPTNLTLSQIHAFGSVPGGDTLSDHSHGQDFQYHQQQSPDRWSSFGQPRPAHTSDVFGDHYMAPSNSLGLMGGFDNVGAPAESMTSQVPFQHQQFQQQGQQSRGHHQHTPSSSSSSSGTGPGPEGAPWISGAPTLHRQLSTSDLSDTSSVSLQNEGISSGSHSNYDPSSPDRVSFTPQESPMGMTNSLSSIAGLAIGTPQHQMLHTPGEAPHSAFSGENHGELLSLSGRSDHNDHHQLHHHHSQHMFQNVPQLMAPPASRRRSTGVAHTLYTGEVRQLRQEMNSADETTPMPPSSHAFHGQQASKDIANMAAGHSGINSQEQQTPARQQHYEGETPASNTSTATMGTSHQRAPSTPSHLPKTFHSFHYMTPQSAGLPQPSPDGESGVGSSLSGSAFSAPRLSRMYSFESTTSASGASSPANGEQPSRSMQNHSGRSLEAAIAEHEAKEHMARAAASAAPNQEHNHHHHHHHQQYQQQQQQHGSIEAEHMHGSVEGGSAMARFASAPSHSVGNGDNTNSLSFGSIPSTPQRNINLGERRGHHEHSQSQHEFAYTRANDGSLPSTPCGPDFPLGYGSQAQFAHALTMSAPQMATSRSMGVLSSPAGMISPSSSIEGTPGSGPHYAGYLAHANSFGSPMGNSHALQSPSSGAARSNLGRARGSSVSGAHIGMPTTPGAVGKARPGAPPPLIVSSADKLHVCHCGKRFKRLEHLKRHNRVHTQERPHQCPAPGCNKWFGRTDNLTQHLKTHYRTLGHSSESLLRITQAAAAAAATSHGSGMGDMGAPPSPLGGLQLQHHHHQLQLQQASHQQHSHPQDAFGLESHEARNDPHAAAAAAAARAVSKTQMKRRITVSNDMLGGPITLTSPNGSPSAMQHDAAGK